MGTAHSNSRSHNKELSQTLRTLLADSKYCAMRDQRAQLSRGVKACLPGSQSQNSNRLMLPAQLSLGIKACFTGNQSEDSNRLMLPAQLSQGSRLASRATNRKTAIAWCYPLAGKEILCIQLSWIGHPIFKAPLTYLVFQHSRSFKQSFFSVALHFYVD